MKSPAVFRSIGGRSLGLAALLATVWGGGAGAQMTLHPSYVLREQPGLREALAQTPLAGITPEDMLRRVPHWAAVDPLLAGRLSIAAAEFAVHEMGRAGAGAGLPAGAIGGLVAPDTVIPSTLAGMPPEVMAGLSDFLAAAQLSAQEFTARLDQATQKNLNPANLSWPEPPRTVHELLERSKRYDAATRPRLRSQFYRLAEQLAKRRGSGMGHTTSAPPIGVDHGGVGAGAFAPAIPPVGGSVGVDAGPMGGVHGVQMPGRGQPGGMVFPPDDVPAGAEARAWELVTGDLRAAYSGYVLVFTAHLYDDPSFMQARGDLLMFVIREADAGVVASFSTREAGGTLRPRWEGAPAVLDPGSMDLWLHRPWVLRRTLTADEAFRLTAFFARYTPPRGLNSLRRDELKAFMVLAWRAAFEAESVEGDYGPLIGKPRDAVSAAVMGLLGFTEPDHSDAQGLVELLPNFLGIGKLALSMPRLGRYVFAQVTDLTGEAAAEAVVSIKRGPGAVQDDLGRLGFPQTVFFRPVLFPPALEAMKLPEDQREATTAAWMMNVSG